MKVRRIPDKLTKTLTFIVLSESGQHTNESTGACLLAPGLKMSGM